MTSAPLTYTSAAGRWTLLATILGSALAGIDATVVNVALPTLGEDLGLDVGKLARLHQTFDIFRQTFLRKHRAIIQHDIGPHHVLRDFLTRQRFNHDLVDDIAVRTNDGAENCQ